VPTNGDALHARGVAHYEAGRWAEGIRLFEAGVALAPEHSKLQAEVAKTRLVR